MEIMLVGKMKINFQNVQERKNVNLRLIIHQTEKNGHLDVQFVVTFKKILNKFSLLN